MMNVVKEDSGTSGFRGAGLALAVLAAVAVAFLFLDEEATTPGRQTAPAPTHSEVPRFHPSAEAARPYPKLQDPARYSIPVVSQAYRIASEIPEVLAQQPCYCYCGESFGHRSLLDCFATDHGAT
jgi:Protein of unknown function with PCYCGC motif